MYIDLAANPALGRSDDLPGARLADKPAAHSRIGTEIAWAQEGDTLRQMGGQ